MKIPLFYIDAFTSETFKGNPAAVCYLDQWLPDEVLQSVAAEHNLSETAFIVKNKETFQIKWFTPKTEVNLCGHATLASAFVLFKIYNFGTRPIVFDSKSGKLMVSQSADGKITLDFPQYPLIPADDAIDSYSGLLNITLDEAYTTSSGHLMLVTGKEQLVKNFTPDFRKIKTIGYPQVLLTAPGRDSDFVLRFFDPAEGIDEDPVTGSAQCVLAPYWSRRLNKKKMFSRQLSGRSGEIWSEISGDRVFISGYASLYMQGTIRISIEQPHKLIAFNEQ